MVWLRLGRGRDIGAVDRLGFLGSWLFRCENPDYEGWISLDFLGFSVQIETFQWVTPDFWRKKFLAPFCRWGGAPGQEPVFLRCRNAVWLIEQA